MTADEMFEELGYKKDEDNSSIRYDIHMIRSIIFNKCSKTVRAEYYLSEGGAIDIMMGEVQAINQKCKEMGWIE